MDQVEYLAPDVVNGLNLYVYCLNNPVMGYDPEGTWNWGKFLVTATIGLIASAAAVVAAVYAPNKKTIELAAAVITTSITASVAAGKEEAFAMDVTGEGVLNVLGGKAGATLVFDFTGKGLNVDGYVHNGYEITYQSRPSFGVSYSVGYISGYNPKDYEGKFYTFGGSVCGYGYEFAQNASGSIKQYSVSFSLVGTNSVTAYSGVETYYPRLF